LYFFYIPKVNKSFIFLKSNNSFFISYICTTIFIFEDKMDGWLWCIWNDYMVKVSNL